jgi:hypothetical protein
VGHFALGNEKPQYVPLHPQTIGGPEGGRLRPRLVVQRLYCYALVALRFETQFQLTACRHQILAAMGGCCGLALHVSVLW